MGYWTEAFLTLVVFSLCYAGFECWKDWKRKQERESDRAGRKPGE
jgi:hypothetical protein